jgi:hypothetical protein
MLARNIQAVLLGDSFGGAADSVILEISSPRGALFEREALRLQVVGGLQLLGLPDAIVVPGTNVMIWEMRSPEKIGKNGVLQHNILWQNFSFALGKGHFLLKFA